MGLNPRVMVWLAAMIMAIVGSDAFGQSAQGRASTLSKPTATTVPTLNRGLSHPGAIGIGGPSAHARPVGASTQPARTPRETRTPIGVRASNSARTVAVRLVGAAKPVGSAKKPGLFKK